MEDIKPKKVTTRRASPVRKTSTAKTVLASRKRAVKKTGEAAVDSPEVIKFQPLAVEAAEKEQPALTETKLTAGRYVFAAGRRKTAVATVKVYVGTQPSTVNRKPLEVYFKHQFLLDEALQAFRLAGMQGQYYFTAIIRGGGQHAQATALRHGLAQALGSLGEETRRVLKKNGLLTRDDRKKERKKPGLRRARRAPQWAKR